MISINSTDVYKWKDILRLVQDHIVEVKSHGVPVAYILSPEEYQDLQEKKKELMEERRILFLKKSNSAE